MRQQLAVWCSFLILLALPFWYLTAANAQDSVTVQGEIVDLACYMAKGSKGPAHKACAQMCAKKGLPIGVLTDHQGVLLLVANDQDLASYEAAKNLAGEQVEISGKKFSKEGIVSLAVSSIKQLEPQAATDTSKLSVASKAH